MPFKYRCLVWISPLVFLLDQWTKWLVRTRLPPRGAIPLIPGYVDFVHVMNTGAAFGLLAGPAATWRTPFFLVVSGLALIGIGWFVRRVPAKDRLLPVILALVAGGIAGNLRDRCRFGAVVDFLSVHWRDRALDAAAFGCRFHLPLEWPAFNVADSAITVSMVLLGYRLLKREP